MKTLYTIISATALAALLIAPAAFACGAHAAAEGDGELAQTTQPTEPTSMPAEGSGEDAPAEGDETAVLETGT